MKWQRSLSCRPAADPLLISRLKGLWQLRLHVTTPLASKLHALLAELDMVADAGREPSPPAQEPAGNTALILTAIEQSKTSLLTHIDQLAEKCNLICADLDKMRGHPTETECCTYSTEDHMAQHDSLLDSLQHAVQNLVAKADDAGNHFQRNSVPPRGGWGRSPSRLC